MPTRCHYGDPVQRFASIILVDDRGWLLLQERDENPVIDPDKWGFVGGHVEEGEDVEVAAYRELEEETGLSIQGLEYAGVTVVHHVHSGSDDDVHVFTRRTDLTDDDIECHEGRQIVFVDPATLPGLDLTAGAIAILPGFLSSDLYQAMVDG
jgi:8-oxo-dGTP pyrophosphatase MutT (NUDIX family)